MEQNWSNTMCLNDSIPNIITWTFLGSILVGCTKQPAIQDACSDLFPFKTINQKLRSTSVNPGEGNSSGNLKSILECGADANTVEPDTILQQAPDGWPPVTLVAFGNAGNPTRQGNDSIWNAESIRMLQLLVDHGAKLDAVNPDGANALMLATIGARVPVVKYLLDKGLDVNVKSNLNTNALFGAVQSGNVELVELLLAKKIEVNLVSKENHTAMDMATQIADDALQAQMRNAPGADPAKVVELLRKHGAKTAAQLGVE